MAYLERLIERATDSSLDLENNQIGSFAITPQHGSNLFVYHIYKIFRKYLYKNILRKIFKMLIKEPKLIRTLILLVHSPAR